MGPLVELTLDNGHYISVTRDGSGRTVPRGSMENESSRTVPSDSSDLSAADAGGEFFCVVGQEHGGACAED